MIRIECSSQIRNSDTEYDFRVLQRFLNSLWRQAWHTPVIFFLTVESSCARGVENAVGGTYGFIALPKKLSIAIFVVKSLMI